MCPKPFRQDRGGSAVTIEAVGIRFGALQLDRVNANRGWDCRPILLWWGSGLRTARGPRGWGL